MPNPALPFAVLDVETTGFRAGVDRVVEIAVVRLDPDLTVRDEFTTLVNPERDVGPTRVHGIRASDVQDAPRFDEIAGDVVERLAGTVVVAHNVRFDAGFIVAELERMGMPAPRFPRLCTLGMTHRLGLDLRSRKLAACCEEAGIQHSGAHVALADAVATSKLLVHYLSLANRAGVDDLEALGCDDIDGGPWWPRIDPTGRVAVRGAPPPAPRPDRLAELLERLSPRPVNAPFLVAAYLELLERVIEDRIVTEDEADSLYEVARTYEMSREQTRDAHLACLRALADAAAEDGTVTAAEKSDLELVARILGYSAAELDALIAHALATQAAAPAPRRPPSSGLECATVCFTGASAYSIEGIRISRAMAEELARNAGLTVLRGVSRKLDLLVVTDAATAASKARRARELSTRVMVESEFWRRLGVRVE